MRGMTLVRALAAGQVPAWNLAEALPWGTPSPLEATQDVGLLLFLCAQDGTGYATYLNTNPPKCPAKRNSIPILQTRRLRLNEEIFTWRSCIGRTKQGLARHLTPNMESVHETTEPSFPPTLGSCAWCLRHTLRGQPLALLYGPLPAKCSQRLSSAWHLRPFPSKPNSPSQPLPHHCPHPPFPPTLCFKPTHHLQTLITAFHSIIQQIFIESL